MNNYDSVLSQLTGAGLIIDGVLITGRLKRCKVEGDRERRGWYSLHEVVAKDGGTLLVGTYGVWRGNDNGAEKIVVERSAFDAAQAAEAKAKMAADRKAADAAREATALDAAHRAAKVWREYRPGDGQSDYLARKCVKAYGVRWSPDDRGTFAIPLRDNVGKVWGLQILRGKQRRPGQLEKEYFPRGLAKKGKYHLIGTIVHTVLIAEGYATAATLAECTGLPVVVAFDAGNLKPVAEEIRRAHKRAGILICADDDYLTDGNPGVKAAKEAALAVDGDWCKPIFTVDRQGKKLTDFNDLYALEGPQAVQRTIQAAVDKLPKTGRPLPLAGAVLPMGGGEKGGKSGLMPSLISVEDAVVRYWGTYGMGGKVLFDEVERRLVHRDDVMNLLPPRSWDMVKTSPLWRVARDTEIGFDPTEKDPSIRCNLFGGWPTVPKAGKCTRLLELLEYLCGNEPNAEDIYLWILNWLAYPLQHRGAKMHSAIVVHGGQGTGKSRFFEAYAKIFGPYGRVLGQEALEDKFNADWAEKKLFIVADEVLARADMYHIKNRLKGFITGDTIRVNPKNVAAHTEKNQMNIVFLSNERMPLVLENDDRRHLVIWVPPKLPETFFAEVNEEMDNGGIEALHHYLLNLPLGDFKPWTKPPMTQAKADLVELGKSSEERFLAEWMAWELEGPDGKILPFCPCLGSHLYKAYEAWCERNGERKRGMKDLISLAGKQPGWSSGASVVTWASLNSTTNKNRKLVVPGKTAIELAWKTHHLENTQTPRWHRDNFVSDKNWLTACFFEFEAAMGIVT
jgi:putative DNA primase/helicase